jgi:formylglycine-generating enzyme required for sulfatase activity
MGTILNTDYWAEIPAGEFLVGIDNVQLESLHDMFRKECAYAERPAQEKHMIDDALERLRNGQTLALSDVEEFMGLTPPVRILGASFGFPRKSVYVERFYIARFPITHTQYYEFLHGTAPIDLAGALEEPEFNEFRTGFLGRATERVYRQCAAQVQIENSVQLCNRLNARLPTSLEWEKAARGIDGRLYPWGNQWNEYAGFFYYGQQLNKKCGDGQPPVNAYPDGVSPYGVWGMAGGLPELVAERADGSAVTHTLDGHPSPWSFNGVGLRVNLRGYHPRHSSPDTAYRDHLLPQPGYREFPTAIALRPVIEKLL